MTNSHYAAVTSSVPPSMTLIAAGPEQFCRASLADWIAQHPLGEFEEAEVLVRADHELGTTTSTGTTITIEDQHGDRVVVLSNPKAPEGMTEAEAGRVIGGGFQPAPFAAWALSPEALRIIADLIEEGR